jgi:GNAT superfamily N-acetyltransferase
MEQAMHIEQSRSFTEAFLVLPMLRTLDAYYPDFEYWFTNKVIPGVVTGDDQMLVAKDGPRIVGVALGKRTEDETKLRCIRVLPAYQNTGIGLRLIDRMLDTLECDRPLCTVAEEMLHLYSRAFINRYGFKLNNVEKGAYRRGKLEYRFN